MQIGTPFTYSFLFDYSAPDTSPDDPTFGGYLGQEAGNGATLAVGDYGFAPDGNIANPRINVSHNRAEASDEIDLDNPNMTATGFSSPPQTAEVVAFGELTNNSILSSDALPPLSVYNLANFHNADRDGFFVEAILRYNDDQQSDIVGTATSLSAELVNPVPEASTTVSLGVMLGLGGLALVVRRRRIAAGQ